ncbi:hypothetical protein J7K50_09015 [bacterium]|nr:hypothetical protein [bacterium]
MARRKNKRKKAVFESIARPDWAKFCTSYKGRGPHRNKKLYRRKVKHRTDWRSAD